YHNFKIKAPRGTPLVIQSEDDNTYDSHSLACLLREKQDIVFPRPILERNEIVPILRSHTSLVPIVISARYLVQPYLIGFIVAQNREINGKWTLTSRSSSTQKFSRYKQAGGGAFIPVTLLVEGPQRYKEFVLERIRFTLPECESVDDTHVECLK
ncbi:hypothetical protein pdam_00017167, partial [Pocillopora damicornis]